MRISGSLLRRIIREQAADGGSSEIDPKPSYSFLQSISNDILRDLNAGETKLVLSKTRYFKVIVTNINEKDDKTVVFDIIWVNDKMQPIIKFGNVTATIDPGGQTYSINGLNAAREITRPWKAKGIPVNDPGLKGLTAALTSTW